MNVIINDYCFCSARHGQPCHRVLCPECGTYIVIHASSTERALNLAETDMHLCRPTRNPLILER